MRLLAGLGLMFSLGLAVGVQPAPAQDSAEVYSKATKELLELSKARADTLIKRQEEIIKNFESATDRKQIVAFFDNAIALIEKAIQGYDENSELWKKYDQVDALIRDSIERTRQKAATDQRWLRFVTLWEERKKASAQDRTDLKKELANSREAVIRLKQDKELIIEEFVIETVKKGQDLFRASIEDFKVINKNMREITKRMDKNLRGGVQN